MRNGGLGDEVLQEIQDCVVSIGLKFMIPVALGSGAVHI